MSPSITASKKTVVVESPEDIVITGMSVRCAQSDNVEEFAKNLFAGVDMVHENLDRCAEDFFGVPKQHGFIRDIRKFDASFFNVHPKQADGMDPQLRILHEVAYESIIDGGVDPAELKNSNTGVFIGTSNSDAREAWTAADVSEIDGYSLIGTHRAFLANRLSFVFDLRGPSFGVDAACATTGVAINQGYLHMKNGVCEAALVGGVGLVYQPKIAYQIKKLGLLASDGKCKVFDESADGYVRSEAIVCILLQKRKNARRIYATLVHSKINNDGFKDQGVTWPSTEAQGQLVAEVYAEAGIDTEDVEYVEAHGTGTKNGDPQETNGIALGFAGTRKKPLPIGAVKSNMGHTEHASGGVATIKVLIAMQAGVIPANLHYKNPNPAIPALMDGRLKVVDKHMPWNCGLVGINSFGFGGQNSHIVLRGNPTVRKEAIADLRLTVYMGRTEEAARSAMEYVNRYPDNPHVPYLLMQSAYARPGAMPYRGYTITNGTKPITATGRVYADRKPVWWIFSGQGAQWASMGKAMMSLEAFRNVIDKCSEILTPLGMNLLEILINYTEAELEDPTISFVGITAIQIALVELFRLMEVSADSFIGHSAGEIGCAYADGCLTMKEALMTAFLRGEAVKKAQLAPGAMAAIGVSWEEAKIICKGYENVTPACHNGEDNVTVSGPVEEVARLVADLESEKVFAKMVNSSGVAFHSPAMARAAEIYYDLLKKELPNAKMRTARWLSTAVGEEHWTSSLAKFASADYFAHNLASVVKFHSAMKKVPSNVIVIEVSPHGLLQAIIRKTVGSAASPVALMHRDVPECLVYYLESIGKLYLLGLNPKVQNLFPTPTLPAPRDTPFLGPVVRWDHSASWRIPEFADFINKGHRTAQHVYDFSAPAHKHYLENVIGGQPRFSVGGFLTLVATAFADETGRAIERFPKLHFTDLQFWAPVICEQEKKLNFSVVITKKTGSFEVILDSVIVVTGFVSAISDDTTDVGAFIQEDQSTEAYLDTVSAYAELEYRGYRHGPTNQPIERVFVDGENAVLRTISPEQTIDGLLQFAALRNPQRTLTVPARIRSIRVDLPSTETTISKYVEQEAQVIVDMDLVLTAGLEIEGITWEVVPDHGPTAPKIGQLVFDSNGSALQHQPIPQHDIKISPENTPQTLNWTSVAYDLIEKAQATSGHTIIINAMSLENPDTGIAIAFATKLGLDVLVVTPKPGKNNTSTPLPIKSSNIFHGDLSNVQVAQKIRQATAGRGVDIVYNLTKVIKLRESLRVAKAAGSIYIDSGTSNSQITDGVFAAAAARNVTVHTGKDIADAEMQSKSVTDFLTSFDIARGDQRDHESKLGQIFFHPSKHYVVHAGRHGHAGMEMAFWLASEGVKNIHLFYAEKQSAASAALRNYIEQLGAKLTVSSMTDISFESAVKNLAQGKVIGGFFSIQASVNDVEMFAKLSTSYDHLVLLESSQPQAAPTITDKMVTAVRRLNSSGHRGLLFRIPSLDSNVSFKRSLSALKTALKNNDKGIFVVADETACPDHQSQNQATNTIENGTMDGNYLVHAVAKIMGIKDFSSLDQFLSLGDYGIDSLMAMELSAVLEQDFDVYLTLQEIRSLTIGDITRMSHQPKTSSQAVLEKPVLLDDAKKHYNLQEIVPKSAAVLLRKVQHGSQTLFIVHPMEGSVVPVLESLGNHLQVMTYGLNCTATMDLTSISTLASSYIKEIKKIQPIGPYNIGGYSFGAGVAFEIALQLQKHGADQVQNLILLEGSHSFVATFTKGMKTGYTVIPGMSKKEMETRKQAAFETAVCSLFVTQLVKTKRQLLTDKLDAASSFEERINVVVKELQGCDELSHLSTDHLRFAARAFAMRLMIADVYKPENSYTGRVTLVKCTDKMIRNLGEFYGLEKVCTDEKLIEAITVPGNHESFIMGENSRITAQHISNAILGVISA